MKNRIGDDWTIADTSIAITAIMAMVGVATYKRSTHDPSRLLGLRAASRLVNVSHSFDELGLENLGFYKKSF